MSTSTASSPTSTSTPSRPRASRARLAHVRVTGDDALGDADRQHLGQVVVAERPQQRPPGDEPGVRPAARRRVHHRRRAHAERPALLDELDVGDDVPERADGGAAADRDRVRRGALRLEVGGELLAGDLQLAPVARRAADVVQLGAEQLGEQLVAGRSLAAGSRTARGAPRGRARRRQPPSSGSGWTGRHRRSPATWRRSAAPRRTGTPACGPCSRRRRGR